MNSHPKAEIIACPTCAAVSRTIRVGGMTKHELLARLQDAGVQLNEHARILFAHDGFSTSAAMSMVETVELSVADLGCAEGACMDRIEERATACGLSLCPLELAAHLRLQYVDQPEGSIGRPPSQHRAPPGSLTVASHLPGASELPSSPEPLRPAGVPSDSDTPRGFYLRKIEGVLWLRGYRSGPDHVWSASDRFVFCRPTGAA